ncbi:MAG TPA: DUF4437 domain-containing protein [Polyangiaceae bacterium]|nr:DUF4437 domain-containing protein [Polyangiaceae bacterium]
MNSISRLGAWASALGLIGTWAILSFAGTKPTGIALDAADLQWDAIPDSGGVSSAALEGEIERGAYKAFIKFPPGASYPLHFHSADLRLVVVSGSYLYALEGQATKKYGPGSYIFVPGGLKHTSGCDRGSACVFFQEQPAKFDEVASSKAKTAEK